MTYSHNTTAFALSLTFDLASIRFKVRPFKLLRTPSPHDHLSHLPFFCILSEQSGCFLFGTEQHTLSENLTQFTDASDISAWAVSAMQWAVGQGLIQGSNGLLRPQANASRAEVATILMRFCELMKK